MDKRAGCSTRKPKKRRKPELPGAPKKKSQLSQRTRLLEGDGVTQIEPLPKRCRAIMQEKVAMAFEPIVDSMIEKAKDGSYNHAQFLMRRLGIDNDGTGDRELGLLPSPASNLFDVLLKDLLCDVAKQAGWESDDNRGQIVSTHEPCRGIGTTPELAGDGSADA